MILFLLNIHSILLKKNGLVRISIIIRKYILVIQEK